MLRGSWKDLHLGKVYSFKECGSGRANKCLINVSLNSVVVIKTLQNLHGYINNDTLGRWLNGGSPKVMSLSLHLAPVNVT